MDLTDPFSILGDFADRHKAKLLLHSIENGTRWAVEVKDPKGLHSGGAKGESPQDAARKLCATLKLKVLTPKSDPPSPPPKAEPITGVIDPATGRTT